MNDLTCKVFRQPGRSRAAAIVALAVIGLLAVSGCQSTSGESAESGQDRSTDGSGTSTATPGSVAGQLPGTLLYLKVDSKIEVIAVADGAARSTSFGDKPTGAGATVVSPDGTRVAVVRSSGEEQPGSGDLVIISAGGAQKVVARNVSWEWGQSPVWSADSSKIMISGESPGYIDVATGQLAKLGSEFPRYLAWSANGEYRAHSVEAKTIVVSKADGTVVTRASLAGEPDCDQHAQCPFAVQAVSNDGQYVATAYGTDDLQQVSQASLVLNTGTGQRVALPETIKDITDILFRADGGLLIETETRLYLTGPDGAVAADFDRPAETKGADLVAYRP